MGKYDISLLIKDTPCNPFFPLWPIYYPSLFPHATTLGGKLVVAGKVALSLLLSLSPNIKKEATTNSI